MFLCLKLIIPGQTSPNMVYKTLHGLAQVLPASPVTTPPPSLRIPWALASAFGWLLDTYLFNAQAPTHLGIFAQAALFPHVLLPYLSSS